MHVRLAAWRASCSVYATPPTSPRRGSGPGAAAAPLLSSEHQRPGSVRAHAAVNARASCSAHATGQAGVAEHRRRAATSA